MYVATSYLSSEAIDMDGYIDTLEYVEEIE
jgi:hypothetical protein